ncbi:MAG: 4Fe-4S dicluster domain-containing protein [Alphaproteobacteria bacterium]|nr:4Fe-4S dicluster domain-containing protein [Alphaproteobacteria bacterium]
MTLDAGRIAKACGAKVTGEISTQLCRSQIDRVRRALGAERPPLIACTQEAPLFVETAGEGPLPGLVDIRETAGWSKEGAEAGPKIAALLAEAMIEPVPTPTMTLKSEGTCLVYGKEATAVEAARQLQGRLDVTVVLDARTEIAPPAVTQFPLFKGRITAARGHLGKFELTFAGHAAVRPSSRGVLAFEAGQDRVTASCDLILDLSGGKPLFAGDAKRDGYVRVDPGNPAAVQKALFDLCDLVGEFEKPLYVAFDAKLCAHSRSKKTGCTRCLDLCPTGAIAPAGDHVAIDPGICAGCGQCAAVCPTGAASYVVPRIGALAARLRALLTTYRAASGSRPVLLFHDGRQGRETLAALARFGDGLPARAIPVALNETTQLGFSALMAAFAYGAEAALILVAPSKREEMAATAAQMGLAETVLAGLGYGSGRIHLLATADPDRLSEALARLPEQAPMVAGDFLPPETDRMLARLALTHLHRHAPLQPERLPLPPGAPFGAVEVRTEGCTLCLACVGACPTGALRDNPERPMLRFREEACIQCGLCRVTCPEKVIALSPRLDFTAEAKAERLVKDEEPLACLRCGKPFAARSSVERMIGQLASHPMFAGDDRAKRRLLMCADCRVVDHFEGKQPLAAGERPRPRTTEDYRSGAAGDDDEPKPKKS